MRGFRRTGVVALLVATVAAAWLVNSRNLGYFAGVACGSVATSVLRAAD